MTLMSPLCLSVLLVTLSAVMMTDAEAEEVGCDDNQFREMQTDFSSCTAGYKAEYGEAVSRAETGDLAMVTCSLLDNMVTVCGEHWTRCHRADEVEVMRAMFVESLVSRNRDATVNIETCESVRKYRSQKNFDIKNYSFQK